MGFKGAEFVWYIQEVFLKQNVDSLTQGETILDFDLGNVTGVSVEQHFGDRNHNSISFKIIMNRIILDLGEKL